MQTCRSLTPERLEAIRAEIAKSNGDTITAIAKRCKTGTATIRAIKEGRLKDMREKQRQAAARNYRSRAVGKSMKLTDERIKEIERAMDAEPEVHAAVIGKRFGVGRQMAMAIRNRRVHEMREGAAQSMKRLRQEEERQAFRSTMPSRCPTCGGMVFMPCLLCSVDPERQQPMRVGSYSPRMASGGVIVLDGRTTRKPYR